MLTGETLCENGWNKTEQSSEEDFVALCQRGYEEFESVHQDAQCGSK